MSGLPWQSWFDDDDREASQALAAAGVLTAKGASIAGTNPASYLSAAIAGSQAGMLDWAAPDDASFQRLRPRDVTALAAAWKQATGESFGAKGVRLLIDSQNMGEANERDRQDLPTYVQALVLPWLTEPSAAQGGAISAVSVGSSAGARVHPWQWPLRMGVGGQGLEPIRQRLEMAKPMRRGQASMESLGSQEIMDVVLRSAAEYAEPLPPHMTGLDLLVGYSGTMEPEWLESAIVTDHPVAYLAVDPAHAPRRTALLTAEILDQFAHDQPLDVAMFDAYRAVLARDPSLRRNPHVPMLFVPRWHAAELFDEVLIGKRARDLLRRLEALPPSLRLGEPPSSAAYLGIARNVRTARDYADSLRSAIEGNLLNFDREIFGSRAVLNLNAHIERSAVDAGISLPDLGTVARSSAEAAGPSVTPPTQPGNKPPEGDRFTDVCLFRGHYFDVADLPAAQKLADQDNLLAGAKYTIEIALRRKRTGISASKEAPAVLNPRQKLETLTIFASVNSCISAIRLEEPLQTVEWQYDKDSSSALFRLTVDDPLPLLMLEGAIEIRLYHKNLDLLDSVILNLSLISNEAKVGPPSELIWPRGGKAAPQLDPDNFVRSLTIDVQPTNNGYKFSFMAHREGGQEVRLFSQRSMTNQDIESLLAKVRDFWTDLVVTKYAAKVTISTPIWREVLRSLAEIGQQAWLLLFGARIQQGASEIIGNWIEDAGLAEGTYIQITHSAALNDFVFPWTLLFPLSKDLTAGAIVDPLEFWGAKFRIEQVAEGRRSTDLAAEPVRVVFGLDHGFGEATAQQDMFAKFEKLSSNRLVVGPVLDASTPFLQSLSEEPARHLVYLFCHGFAPSSRGLYGADLIKALQESLAKVEEGSPERIFCQKLVDLAPRMGQEPWIFIGNEISNSILAKQKFFSGRRPIVFLNMCHSAALVPSMTTGIVRTFLDHDAAAVMGTESPMTSVFANVFAEKFFSHLLGGADVLDSLWNARRHFLRADIRNPLGFAYTLYGRAGTKLGNGPIVGST